jgi:hypothetical protein
MPSKRRRIERGRRGPPFNEAEWLWALGRENEAQAIQPFIQFLDFEREPAIWAEHAEAITREWRRDHHGDSKPPIQVRLEKAEAEREEQRRWREQHGDR